jgi:hypothetical protein
MDNGDCEDESHVWSSRLSNHRSAPDATLRFRSGLSAPQPAQLPRSKQREQIGTHAAAFLVRVANARWRRAVVQGTRPRHKRLGQLGLALVAGSLETDRQRRAAPTAPAETPRCPPELAGACSTVWLEKLGFSQSVVGDARRAASGSEAVMANWLAC